MFGRVLPMPERVSALRHWGGFVVAGMSALAVDVGLLKCATMAGVSPFAGRPFSILCAMVVSWIINRTVTFAVEAPPSWREFGRFAAASFASQLVNYLVFAAILLAHPAAWPSAAIVVASLVAMIVAYLGFKHAAFRNP